MAVRTIEFDIPVDHGRGLTRVHQPPDVRLLLEMGLDPLRIETTRQTDLPRARSTCLMVLRLWNIGNSWASVAAELTRPGLQNRQS